MGMNLEYGAGQFNKENSNNEKLKVDLEMAMEDYIHAFIIFEVVPHSATNDERAALKTDEQGKLQQIVSICCNALKSSEDKAETMEIIDDLIDNVNYKRDSGYDYASLIRVKLFRELVLMLI